jgi:hypothetical protein
MFKSLTNLKNDAVSILSLFASTGTLLCCALPTLLVTLGFGAVVAGLIGEMPWLATLSKHKLWIFIAAGVLIGFNWGLLLYKPSNQDACDVPQKPEQHSEVACETASQFSWFVLWLSTALYLAGFTFAYVAFPVAKMLGLLS